MNFFLTSKRSSKLYTLLLVAGAVWAVDGPGDSVNSNESTQRSGGVDGGDDGENPSQE